MGTNLVSTRKKKYIMVIVIATVSAIMLVISAVIVLTVNSSTYRVNRHFKAADKYIDNMDYRSAVAEYKHIIEIDSMNVDAYIGLADAYIELGKIDKAISVLEDGYEKTGNDTIKQMLDELIEEQEKEEEEQPESQIEEEVNESEGAGETVSEIANPTVVALMNSSIGDTVIFGNEEYCNEWTVLDKNGNRLLLINSYAITYHIFDDTPYDAQEEELTWENSLLRSWLNNEYLNLAFSEEERSLIKLTHLVNNSGVAPDTDDYVFILSPDEANNYYSSNEERVCTFYGGTNPEIWWLRLPGVTRVDVTYVWIDGSVQEWGIEAEMQNIAVRPVFWIDLSDN